MSNFTLQVKSKNQILRETRAKEVFLPFNSEYSLIVKNLNDRRAKVSVSIDGTNILGEDQILIEAGKTLELDRFLIDGNLSSGRKLLFVQADDSRVQDPSSEKNGNIVVKCWLEKEKKIVEHHHHHYYSMPSHFGEPYISTTGTSPYKMSAPIDKCTATWGNTTQYFSKWIKEQSLGATVESDNMSNQTFCYIDENIEYETDCTELFLNLKSCCGNKPSEIVRTEKNIKSVFCKHCGKPIGTEDNYCGSCGTKVN